MKQLTQAEPRRKGRPADYDEATALKVCQLLSSGLSLPKIARLPGMPRVFTITKWMAERPAFDEMFSRARRAYAEVISTEIIEIADKVKLGKKVKRSKDGVEITWGDMVDRARLMVETRKWYLSKVIPRVYGDRVDVNVSGEVDLVAVLRRRLPRPGVDDETAKQKQIEGERLPESDS